MSSFGEYQPPFAEQEAERREELAERYEKIYESRELGPDENVLCWSRDGVGKVCGHAAKRRCGCGRAICDEHTITGHGLPKCPDCDYEVYLGSPGA